MHLSAPMTEAAQWSSQQVNWRTCYLQTNAYAAPNKTFAAFLMLLKACLSRLVSAYFLNRIIHALSFRPFRLQNFFFDNLHIEQFLWRLQWYDKYTSCSLHHTIIIVAHACVFLREIRTLPRAVKCQFANERSIMLPTGIWLIRRCFQQLNDKHFTWYDKSTWKKVPRTSGQVLRTSLSAAFATLLLRLHCTTLMFFVARICCSEACLQMLRLLFRHLAAVKQKQVCQ